MGESPCSFPGYVVVDQLVIVKVEVRGLPVRVHRSDGGGVGGVVAVGVEDGPAVERAARSTYPARVTNELC